VILGRMKHAVVALALAASGCVTGACTSLRL
jgi:hypothetical protein